jgi:hypothetical protein
MIPVLNKLIERIKTPINQSFLKSLFLLSDARGNVLHIYDPKLFAHPVDILGPLQKAGNLMPTYFS